MAVSSISLSPGELEKYEKETSRRLRSERLRQVRQHEDARTGESRRSYLERKQQEEQKQQALEVQTQLEAKKTKLARLLEEQALCAAAQGAAKQAAAQHQRQMVVEEAERERLETHRRALEAQRGSEALRRVREEQLAEQRLEKEQVERQWQVRAGENKRAREAAEASRDAAMERRAIEEQAEAERRELLKMSPQRVRSVDGQGNVDYSRTYYHVISHASASDAPCVEAELHRPLTPPPAVTQWQHAQAASRGRDAEDWIARKRLEADVERRLAAEDAQTWATKVQRVVAAQAAAVARGPAPNLEWGVLRGQAKSAAEAEMESILADVTVTHAVASASSEMTGSDDKGGLATEQAAQQEDLRNSAGYDVKKAAQTCDPAARTVISRATQVEEMQESKGLRTQDRDHGVSASATQSLLVNLDDTLGTCESSSASGSIADRQQFPLQLSPDPSAARRGALAIDGISSRTDSPSGCSLLYDDMIADRARDIVRPIQSAQDYLSAGRLLLSSSAPGSLPAPFAVETTVPNIAFQGEYRENFKPLPSDSEQPAKQTSNAQTESTANMTSQILRISDELDPFSDPVRPQSFDDQNPGLLRSAELARLDAPAVDEDISSATASQRTPAGRSPLPGAARLETLLSEAEALLRETASTAAAAAAAAGIREELLVNPAAPSSGVTNEVSSAASATASVMQHGQGIREEVQVHLQITRERTSPQGASLDPDRALCNADAVLNAVDDFLGAPARYQAAPGASRVEQQHTFDVHQSRSEDPDLQRENVVGGAVRECQAQVPSGSTGGDICSGEIAVGQWVSDARRWGDGDLGVQLEEICRELDEVVGLSTARGRELDGSRCMNTAPAPLWPLPQPIAS